jgi:hypothetical protein
VSEPTVTIPIEDLRKGDVIIDQFGLNWTVGTDPEPGVIGDTTGIVYRLLDPSLGVPSSLSIRAFGSTTQILPRTEGTTP